MVTFDWNWDKYLGHPRPHLIYRGPAGLQINPPDYALLLCVDEKSPIARRINRFPRGVPQLNTNQEPTTDNYRRAMTETKATVVYCPFQQEDNDWQHQQGET